MSDIETYNKAVEFGLINNPYNWHIWKRAYQQGKFDKEEFELQRLYDWLLDENREPANTKFTAGKTRNVAREIEFLLKKK